ncbi:MAG: hydroxymethylbilane synthase [Peptococcaceae bacterium BICA1-7]|nr:MAG: hydroxymethylbilane synthase [Peptococcaceae bacterium BICA1-7]HBV96792.1 hydroxymethylbilane synthase [Desulfotomaculum sp.]
MREIRIGTRESRLAMWQAGWVAERIKEISPGCAVRLVGIKTKGDNILDAALSKIGDKGLFTRELEHAMIREEIDMAVHSMKDLPTLIPDGLTIGAVCLREYPGDVLVSKNGCKLSDLRPGAVIGTSSLRRIAQLKRVRPDFQFVNVRGNLNTRLKKLAEQDIDALVLAYAGLIRLGFRDRISEKLPFDILLPAVGQGAVGVEARVGDRFVMDLLKEIDHGPSRLAISAERALMRRLEGGCQVPIGALAIKDDQELLLEAMVASLDGSAMIRLSLTGSVNDPESLGTRLAEAMLAKGAGEILRKVRQEFDIE